MAHWHDGTGATSAGDSSLYDITTAGAIEYRNYADSASQRITVNVDANEYRELERKVTMFSNLSERHKSLLIKEEIEHQKTKKQLSLFIEAALHLLDFENIKKQMDKLVQVEHFKIQTQHILGQEYKFLENSQKKIKD